MNVIKNSTFWIALILGIVGIIMYFVDYFMAIGFHVGVIGVVLLIVAWLLFVLGVKTTGL